MKEIYFLDIDNYKIIKKEIIKETDVFYFYGDKYNDKVSKYSVWFLWKLNRNLYPSILLRYFLNIEDCKNAILETIENNKNSIWKLNKDNENLNFFYNAI